MAVHAWPIKVRSGPKKCSVSIEFTVGQDFLGWWSLNYNSNWLLLRIQTKALNLGSLPFRYGFHVYSK